MAKAHEDGKGITIRMSAKQLKLNKKIEGLFSRDVGWVGCESFTNDSKNRFTGVKCRCSFWVSLIRSTKAIGSGLYLKKGGCVCQIETDEKGLYLEPA